MVWLDAGSSLADSPDGPWNESPRAHLYTEFDPAIHYKPGIALRTHGLGDSESDAPRPFARPAVMAQSSTLLSKSYGRSLNTRSMCSDPMYALDEVFRLAATSEAHFFETIATKLNGETDDTFVLGSMYSVEAQANLDYFHRLLERHTQANYETLTFLQNRDMLDWPHSQSKKADMALKRLEQDFQYLYQTGKRLQVQCERAMDFMMGAANIAEAQRGLELNRRVFRFSVLVAMYVPLSYTSSIFGMNFVVLNGPWGVTVWTLVTVPIFILSLAVMYWDTTTVLRWAKKIRILNFWST